MSINGSEKEFLMTLFLGKERIIEEVLNIKMGDFQYEKYYQGLKIDMYARTCDLGLEVFVENLLLKSNKIHQKKIIKIIEKIDSGIIVYIAAAFHDKHIEELQKVVKCSGKPISLYFMQLNPKIRIPLENLNQMHKLKVYKNLDMLDIDKPLSLLTKQSIINFPTVMSELKSVRNEVLSDLECKRKESNELLLKMLRNQIEDFLPFHREKAHLQKLRIINFGAGCSESSYFVSLADRRNIAFVELRFGGKNIRIYEALKEKKESIEEKFDEEVRFEENCISIKFRPLENVVDTAKKICVIFGKMIVAFSNYTYYFYEDRKAMWQYHTQGI